MGGYAWVTLATNNSYSLGALVLAHSLKKANTAHKLAVLITPAVSDPMREQLQTVFDLVKVVDVLDSKDEAHLALMKRPDLGITFTKIHCWRLVEFEKCVFLDADTLVVRNCDELFEREEFSAAPDVSWPDCFNSGVFVYRPSVETFNKLLQFAVENRSFDGGDQGLLNQFFSDWATEDIKKHLPFVYNLTSIAAYSYIPAFKHYGSETRIVHFIGTGKPWLQQLDAGTRTVTPTSGSEHLAPLLQQWWDLFCEKVHPNLDKNLESNNDGMPHPPVEACSNSLAIALTDEPQTTRLTEPCTPYREKDDFRQYNLPYQPFDVKGSSGELLNVEFLLSSAPPEEESTEERSHEQPKREEDQTEEVVQPSYNSEETKSRGEETECKSQPNQPNKEQYVEEVENKPEEVEEEEKVEEGQQNQQEEPPPPKDPFDYNSFFPDETCVSNYLEQNVATYQPYENHQNHQQQGTSIERQPETEAPFLPRFLTIPENDRRQSGNVEADTREECEPPKDPIHETPERIEPPPKEPTPPREDPVTEKRELPKSKSMSHLPSDAPATETEPPPRRSIWKSQPNVNVDPNKRYSMPKLKPILPKQNSFSKSVPSAMPKVTLYTEFLMSAEYKDPVDLPNDKVGFVESHIHKEAKLRRCKSDADIRSKFGPLPYALSPEVEKPVIPKKLPPRHLDNELYDLAQCKRQMGNKPKPKDNDDRKENVRPLQALRPIAPAKDKKSTLIKKRKSKELSPGDGGREKMLKREPKIARERRREPKLTPRNVSTNGNGNNLDEILQRLREFSKNYQHFFGVEPKRQTVKCKNAAVQVSEADGAECTASEAYETVRTSVSTKSRETQTGKEAGVTEFRQFRNYIKDKRETSQKGLLGIQDILSETLSDQGGTESEGDSKADNQTVTTESSSLQGVADTTPIHPTVDIPSAEKEVDNSDSNVTSSLEDPNSSERSPSPAEVQIRESETNIPDLDDHNSKNQSLNCAEMQSTGLKVQIRNIEQHKPTEQSAAGIESMEVQIPVLEDNSSADGVRPAEVESKESETNIPISEDSNSKEQSVSSVDTQSEESEIPTPEQSNSAEQSLRIVEAQSEESEINSPESHSTSHQEFNTGEHTISATADTTPTEVTKSEDSNRPNAPDSSAAIQTPETANDRPDTFESVQNPESLTSGPDENDVEEHSGKNGCDCPPPEEQQSSTELKITVESENDTTRGSSENLAVEPVVSSPVIAHNGHASPPQDRKEPKQKKKEQPAKGVDTPKNPHEILCVPDFETPRSSRVALPSKVTPAEEVTTCENGTHPTADRNGDDSEANGFGDSPVGTGRFVGKKKSGRTSPHSPKPSTPICGNPQTGSSEDLKRGSGIAGAIAQLSLEAGAQTPESAAASAAHQEYLRRQNWETGNMDYMGRDSFDNIWSKICQTLEAKEAEEAAAGSPKEVTTEEKKPEADAPTEDPVSLSTILQKCPEFIETLPGDPAAGPVEDDEIIFSKPDNRQQCLTNIAEEKEGRKESSDAAGNVKLSDILQSGTAVGGEKTPDATGGGDVKPVPDEKVGEVADQATADAAKSQQVAAPTVGPVTQTPEQPTGEKTQPSTIPTEEKPQPPVQPVDEKRQPAATPSGEKAEAPAKPAEEKLQPSPTPTGESQPVVAPAESKPAEVPQPDKPECQTAAVPPAPTPPQTPSGQGQPEPQKKATECTTVAIPSPPIVFPGAPFADKPGDKSKKSEDKPEVVSEPIPLPPPESPTLASPEEPAAKTSASDSVKDEGKQKKGVFTKILEMVGVAPKEKDGSETSKSVFYDVEGSAEEAKEIEQASEVKVKSEGEVEEVKKPEESIGREELPPSKPPPEETKTETVAESKAEVTAKEETSPPEKQDGETKPGQAPMPKPARSSQEGKKPADSIQVSSARKSPSPKLTIPQKPPETAITTPTPPPQPDVPPRENSGLLKVDDTILETPPVTEATKEGVVEAVKGKVDDIIGKAKSEVESLLQDRRSAEKEAGESSDLINTMKLMMGADQPEKPAQEEVEELRVTSEEERKRHKGEVASSKLSDQILKAIPPPRRKAISEASASTSAIPKATATPEQKTPPGESKGKPSKPSSIPVPPPRSRGKPTQPSPPKGKGKK